MVSSLNVVACLVLALVPVLELTQHAGLVAAAASSEQTPADEPILSRLDFAALSKIRAETRNLENLAARCVYYDRELRALLRAPNSQSQHELFSQLIGVLERRKLPFNNRQPVLEDLLECEAASRGGPLKAPGQPPVRREVVAGPSPLEPAQLDSYKSQVTPMSQAVKEFQAVKEKVRDDTKDLYAPASVADAGEMYRQDGHRLAAEEPLHADRRPMTETEDSLKGLKKALDKGLDKIEDAVEAVKELKAGAGLHQDSQPDGFARHDEPSHAYPVEDTRGPARFEGTSDDFGPPAQSHHAVPPAEPVHDYSEHLSAGDHSGFRQTPELHYEPSLSGREPAEFYADGRSHLDGGASQRSIPAPGYLERSESGREPVHPSEPGLVPAHHSSEQHSEHSEQSSYPVEPSRWGRSSGYQADSEHSSGYSAEDSHSNYRPAPGHAHYLEPGASGAHAYLDPARQETSLGRDELEAARRESYRGAEQSGGSREWPALGNAHPSPAEEAPRGSRALHEAARDIQGQLEWMHAQIDEALDEALRPTLPAERPVNLWQAKREIGRALARISAELTDLVEAASEAGRADTSRQRRQVEQRLNRMENRLEDLLDDALDGRLDGRKEARDSRAAQEARRQIERGMDRIEERLKDVIEGSGGALPDRYPQQLDVRDSSGEAEAEAEADEERYRQYNSPHLRDPRRPDGVGDERAAMQHAYAGRRGEAYHGPAAAHGRPEARGLHQREPFAGRPARDAGRARARIADEVDEDDGLEDLPENPAERLHPASPRELPHAFYSGRGARPAEPDTYSEARAGPGGSLARWFQRGADKMEANRNQYLDRLQQRRAFGQETAAYEPAGRAFELRLQRAEPPTAPQHPRYAGPAPGQAPFAPQPGAFMPAPVRGNPYSYRASPSFHGPPSGRQDTAKFQMHLSPGSPHQSRPVSFSHMPPMPSL